MRCRGGQRADEGPRWAKRGFHGQGPRGQGGYGGAGSTCKYIRGLQVRGEPEAFMEPERVETGGTWENISCGLKVRGGAKDSREAGNGRAGKAAPSCKS